MVNYFNDVVVKRLTIMQRRSNGRNVFGKITSYHKGGGVRRRFRAVDFSRSVLNVPGFVRKFDYDPIRNVPITLICYANGILSYVLATEGVCMGDSFINTHKYYSDLSYGSSNLLNNFAIGSYIHTIALQPGGIGKLSRAAGCYGQILKRLVNGFVILKLKSGEHRIINGNSMATLGVVANSFYKNVKLTKAGQTRLVGRRPIVRGVAMNPIDHPHGGNTSGGRPSVSPWGKLAKAGKTRGPRRVSNKFILKRRLLNI